MGAKKQHLSATDLRGYSKLAIDATLGVTGMVESLHHSIASRAGILAETPSGRPGGITGLVYSSIRGVTRVVGGLLDTAIAPFAGSPPASNSSPRREALIAALNGVLGDHLAATDNPLAVRMELLLDGVPVERAEKPHGNRLLVLVHGLCMHAGQWRRNGHDHGEMLAEQFQLTPIYLNYNSGLPIAHNGAELSRQLQALLERSPQVEQLHLLGHSMGGLLLRSACHHAELTGASWPKVLRSLGFLGSPHHGAPMERGGYLIDRLLGASPYLKPFARLGEARSAGITDLRHGRIHADVESRSPPLPTGVPTLAVAASTGSDGSSLRERLLGDGLVPVASALGRHEQPELSLKFDEDRQHIVYGIGHFDLLDDRVVQQHLRDWLTALV